MATLFSLPFLNEGYLQYSAVLESWWLSVLATPLPSILMPSIWVSVLGEGGKIQELEPLLCNVLK